MKIILSLCVMYVFIVQTGNAQINANRTRHYVSIVGSGFLRTSTNIKSFGSQALLQKSNMPGVTFGPDYTRVAKSGVTVMAGLKFQIVPVAYRFNVTVQSFGETKQWQDNSAEYSVVQFFVPVQMGYTFKTNRDWEPSINLGANAINLSSYYLRVQSSTDGNQFQLVVQSPQSGPAKWWVTYTASAKLARNLANGDQIFVGLNGNLSNLTIHNGEYAFSLKGRTDNGTYTDNGSYVGLHFGYSFLKKRG